MLPALDILSINPQAEDDSLVDQVGSVITGVSGDLGGLSLADALTVTDGEFAEKVFQRHEEEIHITRRETYVEATEELKRQDEEQKHHAPEWDKLDSDALAKILGSSIDSGLAAPEAERRFKIDGPNELEKGKRPTLRILFLLQLTNLIIMLLIISAFASLIVNATGPGREEWQSYMSFVVILITVLLNACIGAITENSAAGALEALSKLSQPKAMVVRDGKEVLVPSTRICRGDVVLLTVGDIVPADVRLVKADDFKVNEMLLTGEPEDVAKFARMKSKNADLDGHGEKLTPENMAFSSCMVTNGKATAFVVEIGMNTRVGKIALLLSSDNHAATSVHLDGGTSAKRKKPRKRWLPDTTSNQTPLQRSLQSLGVRIGLFAIVACVFVFIVGASLKVYNINYPSANEPVDVILYMIIVSVTLAVAAIPEGIPLCVTISLSTGCSDMVKENVLVRRIAAIETLGCASVICTDKTGTLTEGKMTMVKMVAGGLDFDVSGKGFDPTFGKITYQSGTNRGQDAKDCQAVLSCLTSAIMCCNTKIVQEIDSADGSKKWIPHGNSSEAPIIVAAAKVGRWTDDFGKHMPRIFEIPFSSSRKMMLTVVHCTGGAVHSSKLFPKMGQPPPKFIANVKGAPNFILAECDRWIKPDGSIIPFNDEDKMKVMKRVDELSSEALRVLAIAARPLAEMPFDHENADLDMSSDQKFESIVKPKVGEKMVLLGLVASIDPERDGVPQAVLDAQRGNIRVVMITGDYLPTAIAIARNVNILDRSDNPDSMALDCGRLRPGSIYLPDSDIDILTKTVNVFARAQPEDKLQIVQSLQRQGLVSAMTGDGVNDAPALKKADIGVAMGIQGTEVAKGASDMILTDDNFCSIVKAVEKGRIVYAGIQKFVAYIISVHLAEVVQIFLCIVANIPIMRTPLQILFLVLVTDLGPSIALGMERVSRDIMKDKPRPKTQPILLPWQWKSILVNTLILVVSTVSVYIWALWFFMNRTYRIPDIANQICFGDCSTASAKAGEYDQEVLEHLRFARTTAFVSLVYAENIRAYTSRSFIDPVWSNLCANNAMHKAVFFGQVAFYCAVFIPGLSDQILELEGAKIGWEGWVAALIGGFVTLIGCELYKLFNRYQFQAESKKHTSVVDDQTSPKKLAEKEQVALNRNVKQAEQPAAIS